MIGLQNFCKPSPTQNSCPVLTVKPCFPSHPIPSLPLLQATTVSCSHVCENEGTPDGRGKKFCTVHSLYEQILHHAIYSKFWSTLFKTALKITVKSHSFRNILAQGDRASPGETLRILQQNVLQAQVSGKPEGSIIKDTDKF